jgi:putative ABC transport system permease protein
MALFRRMGNLFRRSRLDDEIDAELKSHIDMRIEENVASGISAEEARRDALVRFGNRVVTKERVAAEDVSQAFSGLWRNVRYAIRQLRRSPGFALTAILTLALGIGPNVAIFSIIWATFLAPVPYPHPEQVVVVWNHYKGERSPTSGDEYAQFAAENRTFQSLDFQSWVVVHLTNPDHTADVIGGLPVSPGLQTRTIGRPVALGRDFRPDEGGPGNDHFVILSHELWQSRYNSDPNILGKSILVQDEPYTVVGVTPPDPNERPGSGGVQFSVPVRLVPGVQTNHFGIMIGRLKPGVTLAQAQADLSVIDRRFALQHKFGGDANARSLTVERFRNDWLDLKIQRNLWLLLASVGLVLLIACANIANLLLARGTARSQELAVRSALGASRRQIFVQLLTESLLLALPGGATGIAIGWGIMKLSMASFPDLMIGSSDTVVEMNLPVLCFAVLISLLAGVVFGYAPGWKATRLNLSETLKQGSRTPGGRSRAPIQSVLVVAEIALALILLSGAGLALHSFWNLSRIDLGFTDDHLLTAELRPRETPGRGGVANLPQPQQIVVQEHQLIDRIRAVPGVADAALATGLPFEGYNTFPFSVAGQPVDKAHPPVADFNAVTPDFFNVLGIRLVRGRLLNENDTLATPYAIMVNETFVRRYLPNVDPLAQRLTLPHLQLVSGGMTTQPHFDEYQIVGVFHDVFEDSHLTGTVQPAMYVAQWQVAIPWVSIAVRTVAADPGTVTRGLQSAVAAVEPTSAIDHVEVMQEVVDGKTTSDRFQMVLLGSFAALALLLAAVGVFGVMAFSVAQRTHEIGIRMALGARRSEVVVLVARGGMRLALIGVVIGLAGAYGLGRLMQTTLYGVGAVDIGSLATVSALLLVVAALACWLPARRSAAIDPMQALRNE